MSDKIEVRIPAKAPEKRRRKMRLTAAGWLAACVLGVCVVSVGLWAAREIRLAGQELEDLPTAAPVPTRTPRPTATATAGPSPTPEGWRWVEDPMLGSYLAPPPEDEAAIREAFEAVLATDLVVTDSPEEVLEWYDREAVLERAFEVSEIEAWETRNWEGWTLLIVPPEHWGPENPVRCIDYDTCEVGQAKTGPYSGFVVYSEDLCQQGGLTAPCLAIPSRVSVGEDPAPYQLYIATIEYEGGLWTVTDLQTKILPPPPSASQP